ncbi:hypothetical protein FKP32DRAFT_1594834 [Trametes sanguinea]|nr:hypothetical protein FKP32DRAFT_1594834 [Trametes sanguinea]
MDQSTPSSGFRTGYLITNEACRRYLEKGIRIRFGGTPSNPQSYLRRRPDESEEQWQARYERHRHEYENEMCGIYRSCLLTVHNKAPAEVRMQLVIPHLKIRAEECPCPGHDICVQTACFVPTGHGGPNEPESDLDRDRLRLFIQGYNSCIRNPERRASAGFAEADFTFVRLPENKISRPMFWDNKKREMRAADRAAWDLYGLPRHEFAHMYLSW